MPTKRKSRHKPSRQLFVWEKTLPRPPKQTEVLSGVVLSKVSFVQPKIFHELYQEVLDDYGHISDRAVYRHLKKLIIDGQVKRVTYEEDSCYLRTGSWMESDCQTDVQDDTCAA